MAKIDLNTASLEELTTIEGIGKVLGKKILKQRKKLGGRFSNISDLLKILGISESLLKKIKLKARVSRSKKRVTKKTKKSSKRGERSVKSPVKKRGKPKKTASEVLKNTALDWAKSIAEDLIEYAVEELEEQVKKTPKKVTKVTTKKTSHRTTKKKPKTPTKIRKMNTSKKLNRAQIMATAEELNVEPAAIQAVIEVESSGGGFLRNGKPKILFEGHIFWRELKKRGINPERYVKGNEDILYEKWTKAFYLGGAKEYHRLSKAIKINREAAFAATSWGMFQVMGFNFVVTKHKNVSDFVKAQHQSEWAHLRAFIDFVKKQNLLRYIQQKNWAKFAEGYNGKAYKKNRYDEKLAAAYEKFKAIS